MGKRLEEYRKDVEAFEEVFLHPDDNIIKRIAVKLTGLIISIPESPAWRAYADVDSPEFLWDDPDLGHDVIERELKESLGESSNGI
jgi:hypothetical protein